MLHDHFNLCEKRLLKLHSTLKKDAVFLKRYNDIFLNQMELGIIEPTVIREDKKTSKVRIVFDASAKSDSPSVNECFYKGPQLTPLVFNILIRFRSFTTVLASDIQKGFLQISINKNDRDYLRFLWFDDAFSDLPKVVRNRLARVIFGVTSSPFILNQTIRKHT